MSASRRALGFGCRVALAGLAATLSACRPRSPEATSDAELAIDSTVTPEAPVPSPPAIPTLAGEGEPRVYALLVVNMSEAEARVFAAAGAASVEVDTIRARDSARVDVRVRADFVELEARGPNGRVLTRERLELSEGGVTRWRIGPGGARSP